MIDSASRAASCSSPAAHLHYARLASDRLHAALLSGPFAFVPDRVRAQTTPLFDLHFRGSPKSSATQAALYFSNYRALLIHEDAGIAWLDVERKGDVLSDHAQACQFDPAWLERRPIDEWRDLSQELDLYLDRVAEYASTGAIRGFSREGKVQAALCARSHPDLAVIDREADFVSPSQSAYDDALATFRGPIVAALLGVSDQAWARRQRENLGGEADVLAIDHRGRLLVIEVKPPDELGSTPWAPAQVALYASAFSAWVGTLGSPQAKAILHQMVRRRVELGLAPELVLADDFEIVPVVAIGEPTDEEEQRVQTKALSRLPTVRTALSTNRLARGLELWRVQADGRVDMIDSRPADN